MLKILRKANQDNTDFSSSSKWPANKSMEFKKLETSVIRNRVYEHYRGNQYLVVDIAKNSDQEGDHFMVIYRALYDHGQLYASSIERFTGLTTDGKQRFTLVDIEEKDRNPNHKYPTLTM